MKKFALLGSDIQYSYSPKIHEIIRKVTGLEYEYAIEDIPHEQMDKEIRRILADYDGFNVTKPYKSLIVQVCDMVSNVAAGCKAINTVIRKEFEGKMLHLGENTDVYGFFRGLEVAGFLPNGEQNVLLIGAGGGARAAAWVLNGHCKLTICNRSDIRAAELIDEMKIKDATAVMTEECTGKYDLIVNATTLGLDGENALPEGVDLEGTAACYDLIYNPAETPFLAAAREAGARTANGIVMLAAQAIRSVEVWFEKQIELKQIGEILAEVGKL